VKTRISMSRELIFGRSGRPAGPKSGLDCGEGEGRGGGAGGGNARVEHGEDCGEEEEEEEEEEMDALEERH
jgi:hypothetical protein